MENFSISEHVLAAAMKLLTDTEEIVGVVEITAEDGSPSSALSSDKEAIVVLKKIEHGGKEYYLGLPK